MKRIQYFFVAGVISLALFACSKGNGRGSTEPPVTTDPIVDNDPLLPGNPTAAKTDAAMPTNYLKNSTYYKIAYHRNKGIPIWVGWHLQKEDMGSAARQDDFRPDAALPSGWKQIQPSDYTSSGFDRGHNCPSADRTTTTVANSSTFLMTNITPVAPNLNQGPWEGLENFVRNTLVGGNSEAYIYSGNLGTGGSGTQGDAAKIGASEVTVPNKIWKVVLVISKGNDDLARITSSSTVLAVNMPNNNTLYSTSGAGKDAWRNYIVTINELETNARTFGIQLDLFKNLPEATKTALKEKRYQ